MRTQRRQAREKEKQELIRLVVQATLNTCPTWHAHEILFEVRPCHWYVRT